MRCLTCSPGPRARPAGRAIAAKVWRTPGWRGAGRGEDNPGRLAQIAALSPSLADPFGWLAPPVLNERTRLAIAADPATGACAAQGFENGAPVPALLRAEA